MKIVGEILYWSMGIGLGVSCVFTLLAGVVLLVRPGALLAANARLNRWIETSGLVSPLDSVHHVERFLYRHHRLIGVLVLGGAIYAIHFLIFGFNKGALISLFGRGLAPGVVGWMIDAIVYALIAGSLLAAVIGGFLLFRPSAIKGFEENANRWFAVDEPLQVLDRPRFGLDALVARNVRATAIAIILGSAYTLLILGKYVFLR